MELDFYHGVTAIQFFLFLRLPDLVYHCCVSSPLLSPVMFRLPYYSFLVILYPTFIIGRYHLQLITGEPQAASRCCPANCQAPDSWPSIRPWQSSWQRDVCSMARTLHDKSTGVQIPHSVWEAFWGLWKVRGRSI